MFSTKIFIQIFITHAFQFTITKSNNYTSTLTIKSSSELAVVGIMFPRYAIPKLINHKNIIKLEKIGNSLCAYFKVVNNEICVNYYKPTLKIYELGIKIERGFCIKACLADKNGVEKLKNVVDVYPTPDFTVFFIAFSTCGCIFSFLTTLFINKKFLA